MGIKSNNPTESYYNFFGASGLDAVSNPTRASGGTVIDDGTHTFHIFTSDGSFKANVGLDIKFLIVGGGGAIYPSGQNTAYGGGGGGGGVVYNDSPQPVIGTYPVVVGERMGTSNPADPEPATPIGPTSTHGNPSSFKGYTAGGGGATGGYMLAGQNGGTGSTLDGLSLIHI